jgi:amidase
MELWELTATEIVENIKNGKASARMVAESVIERLEKVNPSINAVVDSFHKEALSRANILDAKRKSGEELGPLAGVPITVKVIIDQRGKATTNGLRIQKDLIADQDNPVITNLEKAGAVIIGRTNTPAFSLRWFTRNSLHGHTLNPVNSSLTPGGSSGGAAAAVASGIGPIAHGTDIAGSIRYPAYACGIHGLRPSLGRVPSHNFSSPDRYIGAQLMAVSGPLARSIADLRLALSAMIQPSFSDPWFMPVPLNGKVTPKRVALCISPDGMTVAPEVKAALIEAGKLLEAAGWIVDEVKTPPLREAMEKQLILWMAEMAQGAGDAVLLENDPDANIVYKRLKSICPSADLAGVMKVLQSRSTLVRAWRLFLNEYPIMLCPVSGQLPFEDQKDVGSQSDFDDMIEAQLTQVGLPFMGLPGLCVSTGMVGGKPVGVQLVSDQYREDLLLIAGDIIGKTILSVFNP